MQRHDVVSTLRQRCVNVEENLYKRHVSAGLYVGRAKRNLSSMHMQTANASTLCDQALRCQFEKPLA